MRAPVLAVGDGALGFWNALAEVLPETREPKVLGSQNPSTSSARMPKSAQPGAKRPSRTSTTPRTVTTPRRRSRRSPTLYGAKFPKAVKKITEDEPELLAFYDFPAEHWIHLRTTNPIESTFSTVRLRTKVTRGAGSRTAALSMVFKLVEAARQRWRAVNAPHLVALVRAGARFEGGQLVERPDDRLQAEAA
ncbi:Mutator family transposase OS=Streptomyces antimycoticus OX=68175 GN=SSPO_000070 PE=3 SV=1 [Streptomyces antimycoticus]